jgi:plastocyanin
MTDMFCSRSAHRLTLGGAILAAAVAVSSLALAADPTTVTLTIKDHQFTPAEIHVPAGIAVILVIRNEDATAEEIDSPELKIEKIVAGGKEGSVRLRPLERGTYPFTGEYHSDTAKGQLIVD